MSKHTKIWLIIGASLIMIGCLIFGGAMGMVKWDFLGLSTVEYEKNDYEIGDSYRHISIISDTADIILVPSENNKHSVSCYEEKNAKHSVTIKDDTLVIEIVNEKKWYEYVGINFGSPKITVTIPQGEYGAFTVKNDTGDMDIPDCFRFESMDVSVSTGDVKNAASASGQIKIQTSTGKIQLENVSAQGLELSVSTGNVTAKSCRCEEDVTVRVSTGKTRLTDITCRSVFSTGSTGDLYLTNVIAAEKYAIERSTGDVTFDGCDAAEILVKTSTGDVTGSLLTDKIFFTETNTGKIQVSQSTSGGKCEVSTDTGDILIQIK